MNLHGLRLFHEVAKYGSVTKASERLRISQPSVTSQIKKFEKDEGVQLFVPAGRGIQLTSLGESVYQLSQELFAVEKEIVGLFQEATKQKEDVLRLGGNYLTVTHLIPDWKEQFAAFFSGSIELATLNSHDLVKGLLAGQLDMALLGASQVPDSRLACYKVYEDRLCFIGSPILEQAKGQKLSLACLAEADFIGREPASFTQQSLESLYHSSEVALPRFSLIYNNSRDALEATLAGKGIHYCSYLMVSEELEKGDLVEIKVDIAPQPHAIYLYHLMNNPLGKAARDFKQLILTSVG